ncbi:hypothetical protein DRJ17_00355 [Candidatus Woesearchaeota archaeon]|nr:MAG: hypothetical protein DRJ17_00355 [Candidatus Woesearchaeota archaeon]
MHQRSNKSDKILGLIILFTLIIITLIIIPASSALTIKKETTLDSAIIRFNTTEYYNTSIHYGKERTNLNNTIAIPAVMKQHTFIIENLEPDTIYYFIIGLNNTIDNNHGRYYNFKTQEIKDIRILLDALPKYYNRFKFPVSGGSEPNTEITVFLGQKQIPLIGGTTDYMFKTGSSGKFNFSVILNRGFNNVTVISKDPAGNIKTEWFTTTIDIDPPIFVIDPLPKATYKAKLPVTGSVSENVTIFFCDEILTEKDYVTPKNISRCDFKQLTGFNATTGRINDTFPITGEAIHRITFLARDAAGNNATHSFDVKVDVTPPTITITSDPGPYHKTVIKLEGELSEEAWVRVINTGEEAFTQQLNKDFVTIMTSPTGDIILQANDPTDPTRIDLFAEIAKYDKTFHAGPGNFEKYIGIAEGANHLTIIAMDEAGNIAQTSVMFQMVPGANEWQITNVFTIPNEVYTDTMRLGPVEVSLMYDLNYVIGDPTRVKIKSISIDLDGNRLDNHFIAVKDHKGIRAWRDDQNNWFVYNKIQVRQFQGDVYKDLPDTIDFALKVRITYQEAGDKTDTIKIQYIEHKIKVEKPLETSRWLSPKFVNKTIKTLNKGIKGLEKITKYTSSASKAALGICVAHQLYNLFAPYSESNQRSLYSVCDRVGCPSVPPDCNRFGLTSKQINNAITDKKIEAYLDNNNLKDTPENRKIAENALLQKQTKTFKIGNKVFKYEYDLEKATISVNSDIYKSYKQLDSQDFEITTQDNKATIKCKNNKKLVKRTVIGYTGFPGAAVAYGGIGSSGAEEYYICVDNLEYQQFFSDDIQSIRNNPRFGKERLALPRGCYIDKAPYFDDVKCFGKKNINPYDDIITSIQCGCITGIHSHLLNYKRILEAMKQCLSEAYYGKVQGGYCERMIGQYTCDWIGYALRKYATRDRPQTFINRKENMIELMQDNPAKQTIEDRYAGTKLASQIGFTRDGLVNKFCMVAFTGDWTDINALIDTIITVPTPPIIGPMMPKARAGYYNPFTNKLSIDYTISLGIISGSTDVTYRLWLVCDPLSGEHKESCKPQQQPLLIEQYTIPAMSQVTKTMHYNIDTGDWFNKVILEYEYQLGDTYKIHGSFTKPGNDKPKIENIKLMGGLGYMCSFSIVPPGIKCQSLMPEAFFGSVTKHKIMLVPQNKRYYPGSPLFVKFDLESTDAEKPIPISVQWVLKDPDGTEKKRGTISNFMTLTPDKPREIKAIEFGENGPFSNLKEEEEKFRIGPIDISQIISKIENNQPHKISFIVADRRLTQTEEIGSEASTTQVQYYHITAEWVLFKNGQRQTIECQQTKDDEYAVECDADDSDVSNSYINIYLTRPSVKPLSVYAKVDDEVSYILEKTPEKIIPDFKTGRYKLELTLFNDKNNDADPNIQDYTGESAEVLRDSEGNELVLTLEPVYDAMIPKDFNICKHNAKLEIIEPVSRSDVASKPLCKGEDIKVIVANDCGAREANNAYIDIYINNKDRKLICKKENEYKNKISIDNLENIKVRCSTDISDYKDNEDMKTFLQNIFSIGKGEVHADLYYTTDSTPSAVAPVVDADFAEVCEPGAIIAEFKGEEYTSLEHCIQIIEPEVNDCPEKQKTPLPINSKITIKINREGDCSQIPEKVNVYVNQEICPKLLEQTADDEFTCNTKAAIPKNSYLRVIVEDKNRYTVARKSIKVYGCK